MRKKEANKGMQVPYLWNREGLLSGRKVLSAEISGKTDSLLPALLLRVVRRRIISSTRGLFRRSRQNLENLKGESSKIKGRDDISSGRLIRFKIEAMNLHKATANSNENKAIVQTETRDSNSAEGRNTDAAGEISFGKSRADPGASSAGPKDDSGKPFAHGGERRPWPYVRFKCPTDSEIDYESSDLCSSDVPRCSADGISSPLQSVQNVAAPISGAPRTGSEPDKKAESENTSRAAKRSSRPEIRTADLDIAPDKATPQRRRRYILKDATIGTPVKEGHENYVLMYNMLTGIRTAVSRCQAKLPRPATASDFKMANKIAFDTIGNELTPSSLYDFKFKDYAPWAFREIRRNFRIDPAEYLLSLTNKYVLSERSSPGKSGAFFYYSADYRFIIKTIHWSEHRFLRKFLKSYFEHIFKYPNTLIARIFGLHRVKLRRNKKIHFIVMDNILPPDKDVHVLYDLKGSLQGRKATPEEKTKNPRFCVLKDLDWIENKSKLKLGPVRRELFMQQLGVDISFLANHDIMDYSLLVGIHDKLKGNSEGNRGEHLSVFEPDTQIQTEVFSSPGETELGRRERAKAFKSVLSTTDPVCMGSNIDTLPKRDKDERKNFTFYMNEGGFASSDADNCMGTEIYYIGIIDIFTKFGSIKLIENAWKSIRYRQSDISAVKPQYYSKRLYTFISSSIAS